MKRLSLMRISLIIVGVVAAIALALKFCFYLSFADLLASISLLLVLLIAFVQQIHLKRLETIGKETQETTNRLETINKETREIANRLRIEAWLEESIRDFFGIVRGDGKVYKCVFPVQFEHKPLPLINAGDYHALYVLSNRLGAERLDHSLCLRGEKIVVKGTHIIFICAPDATPSSEELFIPNDMPCWIEVGSDGTKQIRLGEVSSLVEYLLSESEPYYAEAKLLDANELYGKYKAQGTYRDYGILARKTDRENRYILIAGIHQPGTWIVAEYLDEVLTRQRGGDTSLLFQPDDFAMVIWGEFEPSHLRVIRRGVEKDYCWQRKNGKWQKVKPPTI